MGRKKKHGKSKKAREVGSKLKEVDLVAPTGSKKRIRRKKSFNAIVVIVGAVLLSVLVYYGIFLASSRNDEERVPFPVSVSSGPGEEVQFSDFLGSETCKSCHQVEYGLWKNSTHGKAGGPPTPDRVIGKFDGQERKFRDASVTPYINEAGEYMFHLKAEGLPDRTFKVHAVIGGGHMVGGGTQTYFTEMPDGTLRFLSYDFHRGEQVWFGELREGGWIPISEDRFLDKIKEYHPSRVLGMNINMRNCQNCHGSQIEMDFDPVEKKYQTRYKSLTINCESCHGPGRRHVKIMNSQRPDTALDIGMQPLAILDKEGSLNVCFSCHALKDVLETGFLPGKDLELFYAIKFPTFSTDPYHPDGRVRKFAYQMNHLHSDCFINGSMTCVDCHDPHSQSYRDINWKPLDNPFSDGQCTSCHASKAINPMLHSFHKEDSQGNKCVSCHMPYLQHKATGDQLRFARSDHSIPIPRPAYDEGIGIENACYQCHQDKTIEWLQEKTEEWYGKLKPHNQAVDNLNRFHTGMDRLTAASLLIKDSSENYIGQMTGLSRFALNYLTPDMEELEPEIVDNIKKYIESMDVDVKSMAFASLHLSGDMDNELHNYLVQKLDELKDDEELKVRARWAHAMPFLAKRFEEAGDFESAVKITKKALEIQPGNISVLMNLAKTYEVSGNYDSAIHYYSEVIRIDGINAYAWLSVGDNFKYKGDDARALSFYKKSADINPWIFISHLNIGIYYFKIGDNESAIASYKKAIEVNPSIAVSYFYLGTVYLKLQDYENALEIVQAGVTLDPADSAGKIMIEFLESR